MSPNDIQTQQEGALFKNKLRIIRKSMMRGLGQSRQEWIMRKDIRQQYAHKKEQFLQRIRDLPDTVEMSLYDGYYIGQINSNKQRSGKGLLKYPVGDVYFGGWKDDCFHGQGTYVFQSGQIYQGLLYQGMKSGHGIYYYDEGKSYYDGEWKNDEKHGFGVYCSEEEEYEGQWEGGSKEGNGHHLNKITLDSYMGDFRNNRRTGKGRIIFGDGSVYSGSFSQDLPHGEGQYQYVNKDVYKGDFNEGRRQGRGVYYFSEGTIFEGEWNNHQKVKGELVLFNGDTFIGIFRNNERYEGVYNYKNGDVYEGTWSQDVKHGRGKLTLANGESYEGEFYEGQKNGYGVYRWRNGQVYRGNFIKDKRSGLGQYEWTDGGYFKGEWKKDRMNGLGCLVKQGVNVVGQFFNDHLSRQVNPQSLPSEYEGVLKFIFSDS